MTIIALILTVSLVSYLFGWQCGADAVFDAWEEDQERRESEKVVDLGDVKKRRLRLV